MVHVPSFDYEGTILDREHLANNAHIKRECRYGGESHNFRARETARSHQVQLESQLQRKKEAAPRFVVI